MNGFEIAAIIGASGFALLCLLAVVEYVIEHIKPKL